MILQPENYEESFLAFAFCDVTFELERLVLKNTDTSSLNRKMSSKLSGMRYK